MTPERAEYPTLQRIRDEVGWDPFDDEPTDLEVLERYISALEAHTRAGDMIAGRTEQPIAVARPGGPDSKYADG